MGINSLSPDFSRASGLAFFLAPLQALASLFMPLHSAAADSGLCTNRAPDNCSPRPRAIDKAGWRLHSRVAPNLPTLYKNVLPRKLKVVREFEPGTGASCAGRMVISGRMADVCAELDRMVQQDDKSLSH